MLAYEYIGKGGEIIISKPKKTNMRRFVYFFPIFLSISFIACGQNIKKENQVKVSENWKVLDEAAFAIHYPDTFELDRSGLMGMSFILFSKQISGNDLFRENINLIIQDLKGYNINFDQHVEISEKQVSTIITEGKIIESKRIKQRVSSSYLHRKTRALRFKMASILLGS
jgi:hypothetical protein